VCGIAGIINNNNLLVDELIFDNMLKSIEHRGPDDDGKWKFKDECSNTTYLFGHRRLSILDLSSKGHQPLVSKDNNYSLIFNGEIYNYIEIKDELIKLGHEFISTGDTEVVLKAYIEWGTDCFTKFNGMWAIAIYDRKLKKTILSRDRFGVKPLFYYKNKNNFVFSSEIKSLLKFPEIVKAPNHEKIFRYISTHYRYIDIDDDTFFKDILQVPKSSYMEIDSDFNIKVTKYWNLKDNLQYNETDEEKIIKCFRDLFIDSVKIRLRSDVEVSCMLSGGLDSTSIASVASKILKKPLVTFSAITGEEKGTYDESEFIKYVVEDTKSIPNYIKPEPSDMFETVTEMLKYHDEPICTATWHMGYIISKRIKDENISVVLNGHGGDELLAGYWEHYHYFFKNLKENGDNNGLEYEVNKWQKNHKKNREELVRRENDIKDFEDSKRSEVDRFIDYSEAFNLDFIKENKKEILLPDVFENNRLTNRLNKELFFETVPASLRAEDRNTMSQSIEARSPFLDYRLAEFCYSLPDKYKIRDGVGKWLLRESMKGILHEEVRTRKDKVGFKSPTEIWFQTINKDQILSLIRSESFKNRGIFNIEFVEKIYEEHLNSEHNHQMFIWQVINLELWFRIFFDKKD